MLLSSHGACDLHRHESAMAAEKEGGVKEAQLAQQRHEKAISELQVPISCFSSQDFGAKYGYLGSVLAFKCRLKSVSVPTVLSPYAKRHCCQAN